MLWTVNSSKKIRMFEEDPIKVELEKQVTLQSKQIKKLEREIANLEAANKYLHRLLGLRQPAAKPPKTVQAKPKPQPKPPAPRPVALQSAPLPKPVAPHVAPPPPKVTAPPPIPVEEKEEPRRYTPVQVSADFPPTLNTSNLCSVQQLQMFWHWLSLRYGTKPFRIIDISARLNLTDSQLKKLLKKLQQEQIAGPAVGDGLVVDYMSQWKLLETTNESAA